MMKTGNTFTKKVILLGVIFLLASGIIACQPGNETVSDVPATQGITPVQPEQGKSSAVPSEQNSGSSSVTDVPPAPTSMLQESEPDPAAIEAAWRTSPHADSFVLDANNENNACARCHAPINWLPTMEDLPESCYACKFELEAPPPLIAEDQWADIPCKICHKVDKKGNVQPEYAWLEIAPLDEYAAVASPMELCLKCHTAAEIPGHATVQVAGDHPNYDCTDCHPAHSTSTSCDAPGCHDSVVAPATPIAGHDVDHQAVSCVACHDGSGMEVGPDEESGTWVTFMASSDGAPGEKIAFTSHNVVLEARCERCHFTGNPWGLAQSVTEP